MQSSALPNEPMSEEKETRKMSLDHTTAMTLHTDRKDQKGIAQTNHQGQDHPTDLTNLSNKESSPLHTLFFWVGGFSSLFVWQSILSLTGYMLGRYHQKAPTFYPFFYNIGGFIGFLLFDKIVSKVTFTQVIIAIPPLQVAFFVVIIIIGEVNPNPAGESSATKLIILLAFVVLMGFFNCIYQTSNIRYSFRFGGKEIAAQQNGAALVGIVCVAISLILALNLQPDQQTLTGGIYVLFLIVALVGIMYINIKYAKTYLKTESEQPAHNEGDVVTHTSDTPIPSPSKFSTLLLILPFFFNMMFTFATSLSIFPALTIELGLGWSENPAAQIQVIIMIFNIGDFLARMAYTIRPLYSDKACFTWSLSRALCLLFVILVLSNTPYSPLVGKWYISVIFILFLSLTNGYINTALFSLSAKRVDKAHQGNSGYLMSLGLLIGLTFGSLTMLVGTKTAF
jgi:Nucleoside transporter